MKKLYSLIGWAVLCAATILALLCLTILCNAPARAAEPIQAYQPLSPWTNYVPNRAAIFLTNSSGGALVIDCSRQRNVALRLMIQMDDTSTDNNNFFLYNSADSVHWSTAPSSIITVPGVSAGKVIEVVTNIDTVGIAAIKFGYVTNVGTAATANITNFAVGFTYKTQSP